jgi:hypothetical protein
MWYGRQGRNAEIEAIALELALLLGIQTRGQNEWRGLDSWSVSRQARGFLTVATMTGPFLHTCESLRRRAAARATLAWERETRNVRLVEVQSGRGAGKQ